MKPFPAFRPFQVRWREPLGRAECPYAFRWVFTVGGYSLRVHKWLRSDDKRFLHDHAFGFLTLVVRGGYVDVTETGREVLRAPALRYRPAEHRHYVEVGPGGALSVLLCGRPRRKWGFWVKGRLLRPLRYFSRMGHPPCHEQ